MWQELTWKSHSFSDCENLSSTSGIGRQQVLKLKGKYFDIQHIVNVYILIAQITFKRSEYLSEDKNQSK